MKLSKILRFPRREIYDAERYEFMQIYSHSRTESERDKHMG
jgi:hypothetical protein